MTWHSPHTHSLRGNSGFRHCLLPYNGVHRDFTMPRIPNCIFFGGWKSMLMTFVGSLDRHLVKGKASSILSFQSFRSGEKWASEFESFCRSFIKWVERAFTRHVCVGLCASMDQPLVSDDFHKQASFICFVRLWSPLCAALGTTMLERRLCRTHTCRRVGSKHEQPSADEAYLSKRGVHTSDASRSICTACNVQPAPCWNFFVTDWTACCR